MDIINDQPLRHHLQLLLSCNFFEKFFKNFSNKTAKCEAQIIKSSQFAVSEKSLKISFFVFSSYKNKILSPFGRLEQFFRIFLAYIK